MRPCRFDRTIDNTARPPDEVADEIDMFVRATSDQPFAG
jgi:hypothetical protein